MLVETSSDTDALGEVQKKRVIAVIISSIEGKVEVQRLDHEKPEVLFGRDTIHVAKFS